MAVVSNQWLRAPQGGHRMNLSSHKIWSVFLFCETLDIFTSKITLCLEWMERVACAQVEICCLYCFTGKFIYIESSPPSVKGNLAQLKSPLLPPAGEKGYCFTFWHHMFGATVGSFRLLLQTTNPLKKTVVKHACSSYFSNSLLYVVSTKEIAEVREGH